MCTLQISSFAYYFIYDSKLLSIIRSLIKYIIMDNPKFKFLTKGTIVTFKEFNSVTTARLARNAMYRNGNIELCLKWSVNHSIANVVKQFHTIKVPSDTIFTIVE